MNDKNPLYLVQMQLDKSQLDTFVNGLRKLHEEMTEIFLYSSESADFPEANTVIDRIRKLK